MEQYVIDVNAIEARRKKIMSSEEWSNFNSLIDDTRMVFQPDVAILQTQVAKGTKNNKRKATDIGTQLVNDYAAGVLSETITSGEEWFEFFDKKRTGVDADKFDAMTKVVLDAINNSNFYIEMYRDQKSAACDGTSCFYEDLVDGKLCYTCVPFGGFWFVQDFRGMPDIVWVSKTTTAGALVGEFGEANVSDKVRTSFEKCPDTEVKIMYYCAPRRKRDEKKEDKKNKPYQLLVYEEDGCHLLDDGGVDMQKFMIYRVSRINNESLGRGPAINTVCTMNAVERCAKDIQRGCRLNAVPVYGIGASMGQNGFKIIHEEDASFMVYNDTGISHPPQAMNPKIDIQFAQTFMEWHIGEMRRMFFLDYFNPVMDKKNITAYQTREIVSKSQQMVDQIIGPFVEERLNPSLKWAIILLGESGAFKDISDSWKQMQFDMKGRIGIRHKSRLANSQKRIRMLSIMEYVGMTLEMSQAIISPKEQAMFLLQTDWKKVPKELIAGTNAPEYILRKPAEAEAEANAMMEAQAQQAQADNAVKMADAASKGGTSPEAGSLTSRIMNGR